MWRRHLDDPRWHLIFVCLLLVPLFAINGRWGQDANGDTEAVAVAAWQLANNGSLDLSEYGSAPDLDDLNIWYVTDRRGRIVSNRAPGLIALATPAYYVAGDAFSNAPATATALIVTLTALIVLWWAFRRLVPIAFATGAILVFAMGTTTWPISSAELWPHGPGQLWAAAAVASISSGSHLAAGSAFALSITTRPITGIFALVTGVGESWRFRSWRPALKIGLASIVGLAALVLYNRYLFGGWSVTGGYSDDFTTGAIERFALQPYLSNLFEMFLGIRHGFLTTSPILGIAAMGAIQYRKHLEQWMITLAWSGILYLVVHAALNRASGGLVVFYRYPLAAIVLMSPALLVGAQKIWNSGKGGRMVLVAASTVSVLLQILNVFVFSCWYTNPVVPACLLP